MGLEDRDWYWRRRARKNDPDDDYLFPSQDGPARKSAVFPIALVLVAVLALLFFGVHQGWFEPGGRSDASKAQAEIAALRAGNPHYSPEGRKPAVPQRRDTPDVQTFHDKHRLAIEFTLFGLMIISPLVLLGLLVGLFIGPLRGPALIGLVLGITGGVVGGNALVSGLLYRLGLLYPADSMGGAFLFLEVVTGSFTLAAITGAVVILVRGKPGPPPSVAAVSPPEVEGTPK